MQFSAITNALAKVGQRFSSVVALLAEATADLVVLTMKMNMKEVMEAADERHIEVSRIIVI